MHVVDGGGLSVGDVGLDREAVCGCPLLAGQEHGAGAVAERSRVARRHRPLGPAEHRLELGQLLHARVRAQILVALEAEEREHEVVLEAGVVGLGQVSVALDRELVLLLAGDAPFLGHDRGVLAHREAGPGLGVARNLGHELLRADAGQSLHPAGRALRPVGVQQHLAQVLVDGDRRVARRVHPAGDGESIWPRAILLAVRIVASRPVPHACWTS